MLLAVRGKSASTTTTYRGLVELFIAWAQSSGQPPGVDGPAAYIASLQKGSSAKLNLSLNAGKAALLQAARKGGMSAREMSVLKVALDDIRLQLIGAMPPRMRFIARLLYAAAARVSEAIGGETERLQARRGHGEGAPTGEGGKKRTVWIPLDWKRSTRSLERKVYLVQTNGGGMYSRDTCIERSKASCPKSIETDSLRTTFVIQEAQI
jgi:integrase